MTLSDLVHLRQKFADIERISLESERMMACHQMPALRAELRALWVMVSTALVEAKLPPEETEG